MKSKHKAVASAVLLGLAILGLVARTPLRKSLKRAAHARETHEGRFSNPEGLAIDSQGTFYVGDQDPGSLLVIDRTGKLIRRIDSLEGYRNGDGEPGGFCRGLYIVVPAPGRVIQTATHNVVELDAGAEPPKLVRIVGRRGKGPGQMDGPEGVSRDVNGDLYVTDEHNRRINVFDAEGAHLRSWSVPQDPQCVTVAGDRVYVSLNKRNYIACYSKDGVERFRIGHEALFPLILAVLLPAAVIGFAIPWLLSRRRMAVVMGAILLAGAGLGCLTDYVRHLGDGEFRLPDCMAVSPDGRELFIVDRLNGRIQVTDLDGRFKRQFASEGSGLGQLSDPKQIAFDPEGLIWVADSGNHRLQAFTPEGRPVKELR